MHRRDASLVPAAAADQQELLRLPEKRFLVAEVDTNPPLKIQRWYWSMVALLVEATGNWPNKEQAHKHFMITAGFFESVVIQGDGSTRFFPMSIAGWGYLDWRTYLDRLMPIIVERYVGETRAQFRNRVDAYIGFKLKEAWET